MSSSTKTNRKGRACLLCFTLSLGIVAICGRPLPRPDEPRVAGIAMEMALTGNFLFPRLNGQPFLEYPFLGYLPQAALFKMTGRGTELLALLPSVLLGLGTTFLTYSLGKLLHGEGLGLTAGLILATTAGFFDLHRRCLVDPAMVFFVTLSLFGFARAYLSSRRQLPFLVLFYAGMAAAFLSKGLIGVAVPAVTVMVFLLLKKNLGGIKELRPVLGLFLFFIPIGLWGQALYLSGGTNALKEVTLQSLWRLSSPSASHAHSFDFYLEPVLLLLEPWLPLLLGAICLQWIWRKKPLKSSALSGYGGLFPLVWFGVVLVGLSIASAKRYIYLAPLFPPFALLAAIGWQYLRENVPALQRWEIPGIAALWLILSATHFFVLLESEKEASVRPIFEVVSRESAGGDALVLLYHPSEVMRGGAVFFLGKTVPVIDGPEALSSLRKDPSPKVVVASMGRGTEKDFDSCLGGSFRLLKEWDLGQKSVARVYSNRAGDPMTRPEK